MNIIDYVNNNTRADRTKHINLNTPCMDAYTKRNTRHSKEGDPIITVMGAMVHATENLKEYLNLSGNTNRHFHTCHLCDSNTKHGQRCVNPEHLYFGSVRENYHDKSSYARKAGGKIGGKKGGKAPASQKCKDEVGKIVQCPHCSKEGGKAIMGRWHFDNCKFK